MTTFLSHDALFSWKDKALFTPGPLTTSRTVKQAMLSDMGSRDPAFIEVIRDIRRRLLQVAGVSSDQYTAVLMQGSGTFGLESVLGTTIPADGKLLVAVNGAYGRRLVKIAQVLKIPVTALEWPEEEPVEAAKVREVLQTDRTITHVVVIHCETTTGLVNDVEAVGAVVASEGRIFIVDAMSSFGAIPLDFGKAGIGFLVSSSNKCLEGVPGFSFVVARTEELLRCRGRARSLSLDLCDQYEGFERDGQFRFTPPTHALLAFRQALVEWELEGGTMARGGRYERNRKVVHEAMVWMGFRPYLRPDRQGPIISSFYYPRDSRFDFRRFYDGLSRRGYLIYPGKVAQAECFRIGHIGRLDESDMRGLMAAIRDVLGELGIEVPLKERL